MEVVELFLAEDKLVAAETLITALRTGVDSTSAYQLYLLPRLLSLQGKVLLAISRAGEATELFERALQIYADRGQQQHWRVAILRSQLGQAMLDDGRADAGLAQLEQAQSDIIDILGAEHPQSRQTSAAVLQFRPAN